MLLVELCCLLYILCGVPGSPPLRGYLLDGKFFLASAIASTLTKLCIRFLQRTQDQDKKNVRRAKGRGVA